MKPYVQIAIRTKSETSGWGVGEALLATLSRDGGLLVPEQVSHNADKFVESFMGVAETEAWWASKGTMRVNGALSEFNDHFAWRRKTTIKSTGSVVHTMRNARGDWFQAQSTYARPLAKESIGIRSSRHGVKFFPLSLECCTFSVTPNSALIRKIIVFKSAHSERL